MKEDSYRSFKAVAISVFLVALICFAFKIAQNGRYIRVGEGAAMFDKWERELIVPNSDGSYCLPNERK